MAIAKRNVGLNGGTIAVASERGRGTTVTIRLPVVEIMETSATTEVIETENLPR